MSKLTNRLLKRAHQAAVRHSTLNAELTKAFNERYGCTYSDVDCDSLIDALDYGAGDLPTVDRCDLEMAFSGRPALTSHTRGTT